MKIDAQTLNSLLFSILLSTLTTLPVSAETISATELDSNWNFYGIGSKKVERGLFYMKENQGSKGVMIVSPEAYPNHVVVNYEMMPMSAASVCVTILSASDSGDGSSLTIPKEYDGSMEHWIENVDNYFFAFNNAAHNKTPFAIRFPQKTKIGQHERNVMRAGAFYSIEVGRHNEKLWLKVDGELIFEGQDNNPLGAGHLAFRIRGLSEETASCLIRNLSVHTTENIETAEK